MTARIPEAWPRLMSEPIAARYVSASKSSFRRYVRQGVFPDSIRISPGKVVWDREDIDRAIELLKGNSSEGDGAWTI